MDIIKKITPSFIKSPIKRMILFAGYFSDFKKFKSLSKNSNRFPLLWKNRNPQLFDRLTETNFDTHYTYHPAWAARILAKTNPSKHVDIASTLHFATMVSAFIPVDFYDFRPAPLKLSGLHSGKADLTNLFFEDNSIESLSCMHTIEHIGLGRYGDPIDPDSDLKAIKELIRVLAPGGNLIFVTPIGKPKIAYNAHRIYSYDQIVHYFSKLKLQEFSLVPDNGLETDLVVNATKEMADAQTYGCGCFWFRK